MDLGIPSCAICLLKHVFGRKLTNRTVYTDRRTSLPSKILFLILWRYRPMSSMIIIIIIHHIYIVLFTVLKDA